ncbi:MAG TPA: glycosyltransferase family 39 protein [Phycisphaerae bacterium]|nr:glycosyltransferase family 39 protein [Phycisphaerae bacterium]
MSPPDGAGRLTAFLTFVMILILAAAVRAALVAGAVSVSRDAARYYLPQALAVREGLSTEAFHAGIPPLYPLLAGLLARMIGDVELACRFISVAAGLTAVTFLFMLSRRLGGDWAAVLSAALLAFHPYQCRFSAEVGPDMLAAALVITVALCLVEYLRRPRWLAAAAIGVALALLSLSRPEAFAYAVPTMLIMVLFPLAGRFRFEPRRVLHVGLLLGLLVLLCLPRLLWVYQRTHTWAIDVRQIAWPARLWRAVTDGTFQYGQMAVWQREGLAGVGDSLESLVASLGPVALVLGIFAIWRRAACVRSRLLWVPGLLILFGILLVLVGNRISKRYLLAAGALWQLWGGAGLTVLVELVVSRVRSPQAKARRVVLPCLVAAGLCVAQLPWALVPLKASRRSERVLGEWIRQNLGAGQRIMSRDPISTWYAQASQVRWLSMRYPKRWSRKLVTYARDHDVRLVVFDADFSDAYPGIFAEVTEGVPPYGPILHQVQDKHGPLTLVQLRAPPGKR